MRPQRGQGLSALVTKIAFLAMFSFISCKRDLAMNYKIPISRINIIANGKLDPTKIHLASEYNLLRALYSPLFEMDGFGDLKPGLAESYEWQGKKLVIQLRKIKSSKGDPINAQDVKISFKRLLDSNTNTHGKLDMFLENGIDSIEANGNQVSFILKSEQKKHFFIKLLASMDFVIIPKNAITKKIDYSNTSGPYYVAKAEENYVILKINSTHYHFSEKMVTELKLIEQGELDLLEELTQGRIDVITTMSGVGESFINDLKKENIDFEVYQSKPIQKYSLDFFENGLKKFGLEERNYIAMKVKNAFINANHKGEIIHNELFPPNGSNGELLETQKEELKQALSKTKKITNKIVITASPKKYPLWKELDFGEMIELRPIVESPYSLPIDKQPDAIISFGDSSFYEDISYLTYIMSMGFISSDKEKVKKWLSDYMEIEDKKERMQELKRFHFKALLDGKMYPIVYSPYYAVSRKGILLNFEKNFAGSPLYKIERE